MGRVFVNGLGDWYSIPGQVVQRLEKWYLMLPCLALSITRYSEREKWSNPGKGVVPFLHHGLAAYEMGALGYVIVPTLWTIMNSFYYRKYLENIHLGVKLTSA